MNLYPHDELHFPISHENAWKLFEKPKPIQVIGKISKTKFFDRSPPEDAILALSYLGQSINPKNNFIDLVWWRESDKVWVYITTRIVERKGPFNLERKEMGVWDSVYVSWDLLDVVGDASAWTGWEDDETQIPYRILDNDNNVL